MGHRGQRKKLLSHSSGQPAIPHQKAHLAALRLHLALPVVHSCRSPRQPGVAPRAHVRASLHSYVSCVLPALLLPLPLLPSPRQPVFQSCGSSSQPGGAPRAHLLASLLSCVSCVLPPLRPSLRQPVFQSCGNPSPAVHRELRRRFYLPPDGLPFFTPSWEERGRAPMSEEEMARIGDDWVVVLAQRPGNERKLEGFEEIRKEVESIFGADRLRIFDGSLTILEGRLG